MTMPDTNVADWKRKKQELEQRLRETGRQMTQKSAAVEFQADTLSRYNEINAYYEPESGRIVRNVYSNKDLDSKIKENISHEAKHAANAKLGIPDVSAEQFYRLVVLDEVSAWTVSALCWREEYLAAEDKEKFLQEAETAPFYTSATVPYDYLEAIREKKVNPESKDPAEFDKEMKLLVGEQFRNMASKSSGYVKNFENGTRLFMNTADREFQHNDTEFERFSRHYMTIGGVDFRRYLENDWQDQIYVPDRIEEAGDNLERDGSADNAQMLAVDGLLYDGKVSLEQYHNLLQHKKIAESIFYNVNEEMKQALQDGSSSYDNQISQSYDLFKKLQTYRGLSGNSMEEFVDVNMALAFNSAKADAKPDQAEYLKKLKEIYTLPGTTVDLSERIAGFDPAAVPIENCPQIDEFCRNPEQYRQDHPYQPLVANALEYNQGDVKWQERSADSRVSEIMKMDVLDSNSDFLKAERENREINQELEQIKKQEEKEKVEPLTTKPEPRPYMSADGVKYYFNRPQQYQNVELKSYVNERGEKIEMTLVDGKKHGAAVLRDENGNIKEVKAYDNGQEIDLSKHKFGIDEQERTINGKPARATTFMLDGKPFGAVVVETADGTKADFYDSRGVRMEGAAGAKIRRTEERVESARNSVRQTMPSAETEHSEEAVPVAKENIPAEKSDTLQVENKPHEEKVQTSHSEETTRVEEKEVAMEKADTLQVKKTPLAEDEQVQPADSVQKVAQEMRRGHDRIAAMRAKVAAGHEADRTAMYREVLGGNDNIEAIRRLRSSKTISSGVVRPTAIRADLLEGKLLNLPDY